MITDKGISVKVFGFNIESIKVHKERKLFKTKRTYVFKAHLYVSRFERLSLNKTLYTDNGTEFQCLHTLSHYDPFYPNSDAWPTKYLIEFSCDESYLSKITTPKNIIVPFNPIHPEITERWA